MTSRYLIYGLVDPRDGQIRYVGQSSQGLARPAQHRMECSLRPSEHTYKARWVRKLQRLGVDYDIAVLEELSGPEDLDIVESFWIAQLRGMGNRLTNASSGGPGTRGMKFSEEHKRKISEAQKGEKSFWYGKKMPDEMRLKMSRAHGGRQVIDGNGKIYATVAEAARQTGFDEDNIRRACKKGYTIGGGRGAPNRYKGLTFNYYCPEGSVTQEEQ